MKRYNIPGQVHFVTARTFKSSPYFNNESCCEMLLEEIEFYRSKYCFRLFGFIIMPDHVHLLIQPLKNTGISKIMQCIKIMTTKRIKRYLIYGRKGRWDDVVDNTYVSKWGNKGSLDDAMDDAYRNRDSSDDVIRAIQEDNVVQINQKYKARQSFHVWQNGFYDFNIYSEKKFIEKLNYIHDNPVKHKLAKNSKDWKYSFYQNYYLDDDSVIEV
ncbi:transposase, partial [Patescibacteria group bacterium]|nr:transposase [Patescibacteria group bacterium]